MKQLTALWAFIVSALGVQDQSSLVEDGKMSLTDEQKATLRNELGGEELYDQAMKALDAALAAEEKESASEAELNDIKAELAAFNQKIKAQVQADEEGNAPQTASDEVKLLLQAFKSQEKQIEKMINEPVGDSPLKVIQGGVGQSHSSTHLFASGKSWDAFEGRNWNRRFAGLSAESTDFNNNANIVKLTEDLDHFILEHPDELKSLFWDTQGLPEEWGRRTGIIDRIASGYIIPGEVTQARKKHWAPKGIFDLQAEEGRVFAKQIDITFSGYELQQIETTWLNKKYNKEGSHPWKMTFIYFLLGEVMKQRKLDSREAQIKGVRVETPPGATGLNLNSQDGLMYNFMYYRDIAKKYRAFDLGTPTEANILDYVERMIKSLPEHIRKSQGLELGLSQKWLDAYNKAAGAAYQIHLSTDEGRTEYGKNHPLNYSNIIFQPVLEDTDFMYITFSKNIEVLEFRPEEKDQFTITHEKRDTHVFADFREGIRFVYVGKKLVAGDPREFDIQMVWSNNQPIFPADYSTPMFDDKTGIANPEYKTVQVDSGWTTDITSVENVYPGEVLKIIGNTSLAGAVNVKDAAPFDLTADFNLKSGGTLTLLVLSDGTLKEISRTTAPAAASSTAVEFDTAVVDGDLGAEYVFTGAATAAITEVINGVEGKSITLYGTDASGVNVTLSTTGNIKVASAATLATSADNITLMLIDGVWYETNREIE